MNKKDKTTAALLGLFLGGLGIQKFYLGEKKLGFISLIPYVGAVLGIIDFFKFLTMSDEKFDSLYNKEYLTHIKEVNELRLQKNKKRMALLDSYGEEIKDKILNGKFWIGMKKEHLILIKGEPTNTEKRETKNSLKETLVYGNKQSGDTFKFVDDELTEYVDK